MGQGCSRSCRVEADVDHASALDETADAARAEAPTEPRSTPVSAAPNNANHGFVPWQFETMYFTANDTTQTLSLLAYGLPTGQPPFALIDGLNLEAVPEPSTWAMMLIGFGLVGGIMRSNRRSPVCREVIRAQIV